LFLTLDPRARRFLDLLNAATRDRGAPDVAELRRAGAALAEFAASVPEVERRADALANGGAPIPLRLYSPRGLAEVELPGLIFFHGGGLVSGDLDTYDRLCAALSQLGHCRVAAVDYRLAPEFRFPAAHEDAYAAVMAIAATPSRWAIDARRLAVGGDSAGGNLAASAARRAGAAGVELALQLLLCPVLDLVGRTASRRELSSGYLIEEATMARCWELYRIDGLASDDPRVAPLRADLAGAPPTLIHTAEYDPLRDEGAAFARALEGAGVPVRHVSHDGLIHHFYALGAVIPAARSALASIGADLRAAFGG
jgi:acetyl esterase/lipase